MLRTLLIGLCAIPLAWLVASALAWALQERLVYSPHQGLTATPAQAGLDWEDVDIRARDGVRLHGWYVPVRSPRAVLLFLHGNAGNLSHRVGALKQFHSLGLSTLIIDYRGFGLSEGIASEQGTYRDAEAAWNYLTRQRGVPPERIIVLGRSLGGAVAAWLASRNDPAALVLESTFTSLEDMAERVYPWLPVRYLIRIRYPTIDYLREVRAPVMLVHSPDDEIVPFGFAGRLYDAAPGERRFVQLSGSHGDAYYQDSRRYLAAWNDFLDDVME